MDGFLERLTIAGIGVFTGASVAQPVLGGITDLFNTGFDLIGGIFG